MEKLNSQDLSSFDIKAEQIRKLKELFPEAFTEGNKIDWEKLRLTLGGQVDVGKERFGMNWPGKADCFKTIQQPSIATLVPAREESIDFDTTQNLFIEGDNLEVLKLLQKSYLGKVKMIYIDPPYNTGTDFIYPDDYSENLQTYLEYTEQVDSEGKKFSTNAETEGRFHSKWLSMMFPRLFLAKNLLKDDGLIFISIDDNEINNLRVVCNEIFGEENLVEQIVWKNKFGAGAATKGFISTHEYILCYSKNPIQNLQGPLSEDEVKKHNRKDAKFNIRGPYRIQPVQTKSLADRPNLVYPIQWKGKEIWPDKQWVWSKERMSAAIANDEVEILETAEGVSINSKQYLKDEKGQLRMGKPTSVLNGPFTQEGTTQLREIFGKDIFSFPKPSNLIKLMIGLVVNEKKEDDCLILDFFAGSASTAQAVIDLNKEDSGKRKFICIQLPEIINPNEEAFKSGYKTIADIGKDRIRRVVQSLRKTNADDTNMFKSDLSILDLGFRVFKLQSSNFSLWKSDVDKAAEAITAQLELNINHISPEATQEAILFELLLKSGFELTTPIQKETITDKIVYSVADGELLVCLEKLLTQEVIKAIAEKKPSRVICLDEGFQNNDQLKTNAVQIMKSKGVVKFQTV